MSETRATLPLANARRGLTIGGIALVAVNLVLTMAGPGAHGSMLPALLWGGAALCFLASFVVYMMEPADRRVQGEGGKAEGPRADGGEDKADASEGSEGADKETAPLFRRGNPLRITRGGTTALVGAFFALLLMGSPTQLRFGVPLGAIFVAIASWGIMDLLGTFDDGDDRLASSTTLGALAAPLIGFVSATLLFVAALTFAQAGRVLPQHVWGVVVAITFALGVAALYEVGRRLGPWAKDETGAERPLWKHHGFWVVVIGAALLFPCMGTYSLWDPWETHYGEVSREILARNDWISLWWAQDGWFFSKPVADMWMQALSMATLGVHYQPDKMLIGNGQTPVMHPEWATRTPVVLVAIIALYLLYKGVSKTFGRRAALLGALVLATMPDWYFIGHQTMTDMPFVGTMTACMGLVLIGLRTPEDAEARAYEVKIGSVRLRLTGWHLVFGLILVCALPQILYLLSRNFEFLWRPGAHGFRPHWDEFRSGSGMGNCGLPGNEECRTTLPASIPRSTGPNPDSIGGMIWRTIGAFEPSLQALLWAVLLGTLLYMNWGERRVRRLYYSAAWLFAAVSTLAKGPAGFGLPVLVTLAYLAASRPGEELFARLQRVVRELTQFEIVGGLIVILVVGIPWWVAMYVRHGSPFTDRLIFHDMFNRAFHHVHDTNEGDDTSFRFYVWQLGYAFFPWTGLAPVGLLWWLRRGVSGAAAPAITSVGGRAPIQATAASVQDDDVRADTSVLLCMWFVFAFALFSFMGTKFHHYIFPAVPPVAMLIGVVLDDMIGRRSMADAQRKRALPAYLLGIAGGVALTVLGIARTQAGSFFGAKPDGHLADPSPVMGIVLAAAGVTMVAFFVWRFRCKTQPAEALEPDDEPRAHGSRMLAAAGVMGALLLVLVARDLIIKPQSSDQPGAIRLLQLFTYNYRRPWPDSLDFSAALTGFGVVAVVLSLALAVRAVRRHAVAAMCAFAFVWGLWGLDVYMQKTAQHWGQHEVIAAYYANRASPDELLVAYQMNWKGENFYTGNHIPAFVSTGATFTSWLKRKREEGVKVMYFVTEHGRIGGLKSEVGAKSFREVTDKTLCNKFVLVRAEL